MASPERRAQLRHTAAIAGFALVSIIIYWQCFTHLAAEGAASGGPQYNAAFVPELLAGVLLALCAVQLGRVWFAAAFRENQEGRLDRGLDDEFEGPDTPDGPDTVFTAPDGRENWLVLRAVVCVVLLSAFIAGISLVGYYIAMPVLLAGVFVTLGVRNILEIVGWSVGLTLLAGYAFGHLLNVVLPPGFLEIAPW